MRRILEFFLVSFAIIIVAGCGGSLPAGVSITTPGASAMQVSLSDAPADQLLSLQLTVNSIVLTSTSNARVGVLPASTTVEASHLAATAQPLAQVTVTQGTYTQAAVNISNVTFTFLNPSTGQPTSQSFPGTFNVPITFNPALVVGQGPVVLNLDLNLAQSLQSLGTGGFVPVMTATLTNLPAPNQQEEGTGAVHDLTGVVTSTGGSSFVLSVNQVSMPLTIAVDGNTQFVGVTGFTSLAPNTIVEVNAVMQANNTLLATKVEAEVGVQQETEGLVVSRTAGSGSTPNTFEIVVQSSAGANAPAPGTVLKVSSDTTTKFILPSDEADLSNLPFAPAFSTFANLALGQRVEVRTMSDFSAVVAQVKLSLQTLSGSPTGQVGNQVTLTLPVDSALRALTGAGSIDFIVQPTTELKGLSSVVPGIPVRVRGLLFFDAPSGRYKLVATRITP